jgi:cytoskeletal protein RodZ
MGVGEKLRDARMERNLTLRDISNKTRISEKFLEKIESGVFDFAPEPYVRAFIRSYARAVGLNPDEVIKQYDLEMSAFKAKKEEKPAVKKIEFDIGAFVSENVIWIVGAVVVLFIVIIAFVGLGEGEKKVVQKKSFESAVEEVSKGVKKEVKTEIKAEEKSVKDSLELKVISTDSVWISVIIDSSTVREFLMPPNMSLTLKARNNFNFTLGNAGGVKFILDGHEIESPGKKGTVLRNYIIDREKLKQISN